MPDPARIHEPFRLYIRLNTGRRDWEDYPTLEEAECRAREIVREESRIVGFCLVELRDFTQIGGIWTVSGVQKLLWGDI